VQAQKFGAEVAIANSAIHLRCEPQPFEIELSGGHLVRGRAIIIASGVQYRKLALSNIEQFQGVGIYYAATYIEAQLCKDEDVVIVGGGNSAGQAAVFLASNCKHVNLLVRSNGLAESMSRYLVRRIEDTPNITLRTCTEITALEGDSSLEQVTWHCTLDNRTQKSPIRHVFLMTGAVPNTSWLEGCLALDEKGFVKTGLDLRAHAASGRWPLERQPYMFETTVPRIFAVGDVRCSSVKRVAAAVGEGSACVALVHRVLAE
jgi:thioredoxin reductase (NADPH)